MDPCWRRHGGIQFCPGDVNGWPWTSTPCGFVWFESCQVPLSLSLSALWLFEVNWGWVITCDYYVTLVWSRGCWVLMGVQARGGCGHAEGVVMGVPRLPKIIDTSLRGTIRGRSRYRSAPRSQTPWSFRPDDEEVLDSEDRAPVTADLQCGYPWRTTRSRP